MYTILLYHYNQPTHKNWASKIIVEAQMMMIVLTWVSAQKFENWGDGAIWYLPLVQTILWLLLLYSKHESLMKTQASHRAQAI